MAITSVFPLIMRIGKELSTAFRNMASNRVGSSGLTFPQTNPKSVFEGIQPTTTNPDSPSTGKSTGRGFAVNGFLKKVANVLEQNVFAIISGGQSSERPHYYEPFFKQVEPKDEKVLEQILRDLVNETAQSVPPLKESEVQAFITKLVDLFFELRLPKYYIKGQHIKAGGKEGEEVSPWTQLQGLIGTSLNLPAGLVQMWHIGKKST